MPRGERQVDPSPRSTSDLALTKARFDGFLRWTICEEKPAVARFLPDHEAISFLDYYRTLPSPRDEVRIARFLRGSWRSEAGWVASWIASRAGDGGRSPVQVLDAGSGFGTFSMLFAAVGADVTGVDLRPDRLDAARRRVWYYRRRVGHDLSVRFERQDLTKPWPQTYDLVWAYNAISHIDPPEAFLVQVREHLSPGGLLVIGDINGANPSHLRRLSRLRQEVAQEYLSPDGERHAYAVERTFTPQALSDCLETHGFQVLRHNMHFAGQGALPNLLYDGLRAAFRPSTRWAPWAHRQMIACRPAEKPPLDRTV